MIDRRGLLKLFGAGATIVPLAKGVPQLEAQALIVEPPKVELAPPPEIVLAEEIPLGDVDVAVFIRDRTSGKQYRMHCHAFVSESQDSWRTPDSQMVPGLVDVTLKARGEVEVVQTK